MIPGLFLPAERPVWLSNEFSFFFFFFADCFRVNIFLTTGHFFHLVYLGVFIDQSSSSQIHPKCSLGQDSQTCEMRQDSPKVWSEPSFETSTKTLQSFKASLSWCVGVGGEGKFDTPYTFGTGADIGNPESPGYSWQSARLTSGKFPFKKCQF